MSVFGAYSFVEVPKEIISRLIGLAIILFVLLKFFKILKFDPNNSTMILGGGITGFVSGLVFDSTGTCDRTAYRTASTWYHGPCTVVGPKSMGMRR